MPTCKAFREVERELAEDWRAMIVSPTNRQITDMNGVEWRQLTLADTKTRMLLQQRLVFCGTGPKGGPEHDLSKCVRLMNECSGGFIPIIPLE